MSPPTRTSQLLTPSPMLLRFLRSQIAPAPSRPTCHPFRAPFCARRVRLSSGMSKAPKGDQKLLPAPRCSQPSYPSFWQADQSLDAHQRLHAESLLPGEQNPITRSRRSSHGELKRPIFRRLFSSQPQSWWWRWWPGSVTPRGRQLPPLSSFLDASSSSARSMKAANEPRLRCTEFNENGNVTLVNGEFKKSELIAKYGLLPRDLRKIDSSLLPHILVRPRAILINLLHLRVLIQHDRVLVFDAYGSTDSYTQSVFMYDLEGKLRQLDARVNGSLPYELRALEAVLISVTNALEVEFEGVREPIIRVLRELEDNIDRDKLRYLLIYSKKLGTFEQTARLVRDALEELLEADDDLAAMYLTAKAEGKQREETEHTEVELLLESYHKVTNEIVQAAENLVSSIRNTEEIVKAILDANRNSLMLLELKFSIYTLGLSAGTFIAALYGMNLKNFIEESDGGFWGVSFTCAIVSGIVLAYGLKVLRRVQVVSMWGSGGGGGSHWSGSTPMLPGPGAGGMDAAFGTPQRAVSQSWGGINQKWNEWRDAKTAERINDRDTKDKARERFREQNPPLQHAQGPLWSKGGKKD